MKANLFRLFILTLVVAGAVYISLPSTTTINLGLFKKEVEFRKGLDLAGGVQLIYEVDLSEVEPGGQNDAVRGVIQTIDRRINALGVAEPTIQETNIGSSRSILIELPGVSNTGEAIDLIGQTAKLEFYETTEEPSQDPNNPELVPTGLTGNSITDAAVEYQTGQQAGSISAGEPVVRIDFDSEGREMFKNITDKNLGKPVAIVIDNQVISAPVVQAVIDQGTAVISGSFDTKSAKQLEIALKSGQLQAPINLVQERTIDASLGKKSIEKSALGAAVGVVLLILFMCLYYGGKGVLASIALTAYIIILFALFKFVPITVTLAGIAGLVVSIGAAVDANILIFERMKEEQARGRYVHDAIDIGFKRAWSSIRDSNIASIIIAIILIWFGSGIVKGFAVTLLLGILVSMFSAITITQTLLKTFLKNKPGQDLGKKGQS